MNHHQRPKPMRAPTISNSNLPLFLALFVLLSSLLASASFAQQGFSAEKRDSLRVADMEKVRIPDVPLPLPEADTIVSLDGILAYADQNSPTVEVARQRVGLGDAAMVAAEPWLPKNPKLSFAAGPRLSNLGFQADFSASVNQTLEVAGERGLRIKFAKQKKTRLAAELEEAKWQVHHDVHAAFHVALVARERELAADRLLLFQQKLVGITQARLVAGDVSPLAVRVAEGELSQTRITHITAAQAFTAARLRLGALAGWPVPLLPMPAGVLDMARPPPSSADLMAIARRHQPRLRTFLAAKEEAKAKREVAERVAWPKPTLGIQITQEGTLSQQGETLVLGTFSIPIPVVRRNQGARAKAQVELNILEAQQYAFVAQLRNQIEAHRSAAEAASSRVQNFGGEILPTFEENLRLIQRAFELGEIDILQVSIVRERFLRIQTDALDAYADYFKAVADLEAAIGTDLWPDREHPAPSQNDDVKTSQELKPVEKKETP